MTKSQRYYQRDNETLGQNPSVLAYNLRQNYMFYLVKKANKNICHRCGQIIDSVDELSIEHIQNWQPTETFVGNKDLFFEPSNLAWSHQCCNYAASRIGTNDNGYIGIASYYDHGDRAKINKKYKAEIGFDGGRKGLSRFPTAKEAAICYDIGVFYYRNGKGTLNFEQFRSEYKSYLQPWLNKEIFYKRGPIKQIVAYFYKKLQTTP